MTEERRINEELASLLQEFGDLKVKYREEKEKNDAVELVIVISYIHITSSTVAKSRYIIGNRIENRHKIRFLN
jgi:hypothetical protein